VLRVVASGVGRLQIVDQLAEPLRIAVALRGGGKAGVGEFLARRGELGNTGQLQQAVAAELAHEVRPLIVGGIQLDELLEDRRRELGVLELHEREHRAEVVLGFRARELQRRKHRRVSFRSKVLRRRRAGFSRRGGRHLRVRGTHRQHRRHEDRQNQ
jgi:hypothetical protein